MQLFVVRDPIGVWQADPVQPTRRQALAAGAAVLTAACTTSAPPPRPRVRTADDELRDAAAAREQALIDAYAAAVATRPELQGVLTDHAAHLVLLAPAVPPTPAVAAAAPSPRALAGQERAAAAAHAKAALTASRELAALLASLAACEASHAAVL